jgi:hypothetical protein
MLTLGNLKGTNVPKSVFTVAGQDGLHYEVLAECTDSIEMIIERAAFRYRKSMRDVVSERRLTRVEESAVLPRLGWGVRGSRRSKKVEDL